MPMVYISDSDGDDGANLDLEIRDAIMHDDKPTFVSRVKNGYWSPIRPLACPSDILEELIYTEAIDCATALLEGETVLSLDLNVPIEDEYPLHLVADDLSYGMIDLFLRHGARTDVRTTETEWIKGNLLPLNVAVERLSHHRYLVKWTPRQSIFKLIVLLCLPQMKAPLEVCRLLALNTREVGDVFIDYAMGGQLIEMAALLIVARGMVMAPSMCQSEECSDLDASMAIRDRILVENALLTQEEAKLMCHEKNRKLVRLCKNKQAVMTRALVLLEVFERIGDRIETYIQSSRCQIPIEMLVKDIKALIEGGGFVLKDKDIDLSDVDCESENIMPATEILEMRTPFRSQIQSDIVPLYQSSDSFHEEKRNPITYTKNGINRSMGSFFPHVSSALFHHGTFPISLSSSKRTRYSQVKKNSTTVESSKSLSSKRLCSILLAMKRGIRRMG